MKIYDNGELVHVYSSSDVLLHYGRKGMKWGVRNSIRNVRDRWNNLPEHRRKQIKSVAKTLAKTAAISLGTLALGRIARDTFFTKEPAAWEVAASKPSPMTASDKARLEKMILAAREQAKKDAAARFGNRG